MNMKFVRTWVMLALTLVVGLSVTGGTIAWFTDSVTSSANVIEAGNLDVTLEYYDTLLKEFKPVNEQTKLFKENSRWEPGYTEVVYLKVANAGNLALKYKLSVNVSDEKTGINVFDKEFKLSDYLTGVTKEITATEVGTFTREQARAMATADSAPLASYSTNDIPLVNQNDAKYYALAVCMPTTVDNNANHKTGTTAPSLNLGVKLLATQYNHEADSFDSNYDLYAMNNGDTWNGTTPETPEADETVQTGGAEG